MTALTTLFPVFFMLALGFIARVKGWITLEQKNGANAIIFKILFPILVLNLMCTATIETDHIKIIGYVFGVYLLALVAGKLLAPLAGKKYAHFSPYLLTVVEGGNVALPLYLSIVGKSSNTVIFDIAGTVIAFIVFPVLIAKEAATGSSMKEMIKSIFTNSFVIVYYAMVIAGFFILFPAQMADKTFMMAPIIYFMCPTGFGLMPVIAPLYKDEDDASFTSAFVSIFMIITLIVYTLVVIFIA